MCPPAAAFVLAWSTSHIWCALKSRIAAVPAGLCHFRPRASKSRLMGDQRSRSSPSCVTWRPRGRALRRCVCADRCSQALLCRPYIITINHISESPPIFIEMGCAGLAEVVPDFRLQADATGDHGVTPSMNVANIQKLPGCAETVKNSIKLRRSLTSRLAAVGERGHSGVMSPQTEIFCKGSGVT